MLKRLAVLCLAGGVLAACGFSDAKVVGRDEASGEAKQEEAWGSGDAPSLFTSTLEYQLAALPTSGEAATIPWAGSYWPTYEDNINHQWQGAGSDSPAMKYQKAFGGTNVEDAVSRYHGIDSATAQKACQAASECNSSLGEACAKRRGATSGRCIPTWWGICHAWSPAAILWPEPPKAVTRNGVTFNVSDLKALASLVHNRTSSKFVSLRCDQNNSSGGIVFDQYGRPTGGSASCKDTNPGTYHVLLANYLGKMKTAFVEDRTFDSQVWNQPLRGYRVLENRAVTAAEANRLIGVTTTGGTTTTLDGTVAQGAWAHQAAISVTAGSSVVVQMSGSGDGDLSAKFGSQPTASSYDCRPYQSSSAERCELTVPAGTTQLFISINGYAAATFKLAITTGGSTPVSYVFNANARSFAYVQSEVKYISEAAAEQDGPLRSVIDRYTGVDRYEYVLELDTAGKIIGGEWVGSSKVAHPDFVWLPTGVGASSVAGGAITYANVKSLVDESNGGGGGGGGTEKTVNASATVAMGELKLFGPYDVSSGGSFSVAMTGDGDGDLYVRKGAAPTTTTYDCRPYRSGSTESCTAAGPGGVYVGVHGYAASSTVALVIKYN